MIKLNNKDLGYLGEDFASQYLKKNNYNILIRNYKCLEGEIDIICSYKGLLCFVEVKTRKNTLYGLPCEAVNNKKKYKIKRSALSYINSSKRFFSNIRFDVLEVYVNENLSLKSINFIENAF